MNNKRGHSPKQPPCHGRCHVSPPKVCGEQKGGRPAALLLHLSEAVHGKVGYFWVGSSQDLDTWLITMDYGDRKSPTLPETNIFAPENGWLEYYFPIGVPAYFQGLR